MSRCVVLQYTSTKCHPKTGKPYQWTNIVDADKAEEWKRDAEQRWPDVTVEIKPLRRRKGDDDG